MSSLFYMYYLKEVEYTYRRMLFVDDGYENHSEETQGLKRDKGEAARAAIRKRKRRSL
ncbi:hypothetical protein J2S78_001508 [Salibacterium salarium]|nr:hypothetical protein [Salibacterium salarium]